jgi:hypothetical protein
VFIKAVEVDVMRHQADIYILIADEERAVQLSPCKMTGYAPIYTYSSANLSERK